MDFRCTTSFSELVKGIRLKTKISKRKVADIQHSLLHDEVLKMY